MKIDLSRFADKFRAETRDNLTLFDGSLLTLEQFADKGGSGFDEAVRELMRIAHAIKGAARMIGFHPINSLCHALEELLIALRAHGKANQASLNLILQSRRSINKLLNLEPNTDLTNYRDYDWLTELQNNLRSVSLDDDLEPQPISKIQKTDKDNTNLVSSPITNWRDTTVRVDIEDIDHLLLFGRELAQALENLNNYISKLENIQHQLEDRLSQKSRYNDPEVIIQEDNDIGSTLHKTVLLLRESLADVDRYVRQIDSGAVELRMHPLRELYETLPLQVRDLAQSLKKEARLITYDEAVRLDSRIIDLLNEPLIHIIRNAMDHGLESPEERQHIGKSPQGTITLRAQENAGWVKITIEDDGRGVDLENVWKKAYSLGIVSDADHRSRTIAEIFQLLFDDRFTSKEGASDISGRGVGLSAVRRRISELRGSVSIESDVGKGTRIILTFPTSLSSQRILVTAIALPNDEPMIVGIPTAMVKAAGKKTKDLNETIDPHLRLLPEREIDQINLNHLFGGNGFLKNTSDFPYWALLDDGSCQGILPISAIIAETEAIIQPLPTLARQIDVIAGAAQLTADRIMLVLNVPQILTKIN